jgi:tRNA1Val (adenine37-N6)-methyltransferase
MKVTTDGCLFGSWAAERVGSLESGDRRMLDIGTGTGLLSLMLAQKTDLSVDTIEIDKDAFEQAKENIAASSWKDRINIFHANAGEFLFPSQYDIIVCNPPFYENELKSGDAKKNMAHHGGLTLQQLLGIIKKNLSPEGRFYLLLPYKRNEETEKLINSNDLFIIQKTLVKQSVKHEYFRIMIAGGHVKYKKEMIAAELAIRNEKEEYTKDFIDLLKDYYLFL